MSVREAGAQWDATLRLEEAFRGRIRTANIRPPIGTTRFDWSAVLDDYDGAPDSGWQPVGYGSTEADAITDLLAEIREHEE